MKDLPTYNIHGTEFQVDTVKNEFREVLNPANRIRFGELLFKGDHYELHYDTETKNTYKGNLDDAVGMESVVTAKIPLLHKLDPDMKARILERIGSRQRKRDQGPGTSQAWTRKR